jgi:hypothetical protein
MYPTFRQFAVLASLACAVMLSGCGNADNSNSQTTSTTNANAPTISPAAQDLKVVERPQAIKDKMAARGEQDQANPVLKFVTPTDGSTVASSTVKLKLDISGDLKGYKPMKDPATGMGNHIHVILDNAPYEAYYNLDQPFELRNVADGEHTLRVFASRPWHESYKNDGNFQMVKFTVKQGGADTGRPTTTKTGEKMADNANTKANTNANANTAAPPAEGKDMPGPRANTKAATPMRS